MTKKLPVRETLELVLVRPTAGQYEGKTMLSINYNGIPKTTLEFAHGTTLASVICSHQLAAIMALEEQGDYL